MPLFPLRSAWSRGGRHARRAMGIVLIAPAGLMAQGAATGMARLPAGTYLPLYASEPGRPQAVGAFQLDQHQVTRGDYLAFVRSHPDWQRGRIRTVYADGGYLADWPAPLDAGTGNELSLPVTSVSWFAARTYCAAQGKRLPTVDEWECDRDGRRAVRGAAVG